MFRPEYLLRIAKRHLNYPNKIYTTH